MADIDAKYCIKRQKAENRKSSNDVRFISQTNLIL